MAEYESISLRALNEEALVTNKTLEDHDKQVELIMEAVKHVEIRKMEILSERKKQQTVAPTKPGAPSASPGV